MAICVLYVSASQDVPNPSFEDGDNLPYGWRLSEGEGTWEKEGHTGSRSISVAGTGEDSNYWFAPQFKLNPRTLYRVSFWTRISPGTSGGSAITGSNVVNRDFRPSTNWERFSFVFQTPIDTTFAFLRFGQWHVRGKIWFDDISLSAVKPVHRTSKGIKLGHGERVLNGEYIFAPNFGYEGSNYSRPLLEHTAGFNSNRWTFVEGLFVVYRHRIEGYRQLSGKVRVNVGYHVGGECLIEASRDGGDWTEIGRISSLGSGEFDLPNDLFPADEIYVRLKAPARDGSGVNFQVRGYEYRAKLDGSPPNLVGETYFLDETVHDEDLVVDVNLGWLPPEGEGFAVGVWLKSKSDALVGKMLSVRTKLDGEELENPVRIGSTKEKVRIKRSVLSGGDHSFEVKVLEGDRLLYEGRMDFYMPYLYAADYGYLISSDEDMDLWWCESTYKIARERPVPSEENPTVSIYAARNEYEPFQIVLRPKTRMKDVTVEVSDLRGEKGIISKDNISIMHVDYVFVKIPTDYTGCVDYHPDPLPPYEGPFDLESDLNHPLWFLVYVPKGTPPGDYSGKVTIRSGSWSQEVKLKLYVWDFELADEPHVQSAFGFSPGNVKRYHHIKDEGKFQEVLDKYYRSFRDHRISPYHPMAPIRVSFRRPDGVENPTPEQIEIELDFSEFDRTAHKYLDEYHFTSFRLPLKGLGGGTFHSRYLGELAGFKQGTAEHEALFTRYVRRIQEHLEEKGWLRKAYVYWFDEPEPKDYEFVKDGMALIHRAGPKLTRMLTEEPAPELYGYVDLWCPVTPNYDHRTAEERRKHGERFWWYICTGPKAPFCTLFIDHPAVELRMWLWQTWMYKVEGILIWQTNYWTSPAAFPDSPQNPYEDPMSYVSGYGRPPGYIGYWGNGDGRFLYPPKKALQSEEECLEGPVSSIRWEMLREGIEDYEYLWTLRETIERKRSKELSEEEKELIKEAERLLEVPTEICASMTDFTRDPRPIFERRLKVARMIERLLSR
jgi:hypothetical protein